MPKHKRKDPYTSFRFRLELDSILVASFTEVTGLQSEIVLEPYEEGGLNNFVYQLPTRTKHQNITLKRGFTDNKELWEWHQDVVNGKFKRKSGSIILLDEVKEGEEIGRDKWRWNIIEAFPVKWTGPDFKADNNSVAFETIELAHHGFKKIG